MPRTGKGSWPTQPAVQTARLTCSAARRLARRGTVSFPGTGGVLSERPGTLQGALHADGRRYRLC